MMQEHGPSLRALLQHTGIGQGLLDAEDRLPMAVDDGARTETDGVRDGELNVYYNTVSTKLVIQVFSASQGAWFSFSSD